MDLGANWYFCKINTSKLFLKKFIYSLVGPFWFLIGALPQAWGWIASRLGAFRKCTSICKSSLSSQPMWTGHWSSFLTLANGRLPLLVLKNTNIATFLQNYFSFFHLLIFLAGSVISLILEGEGWGGCLFPDHKCSLSPLWDYIFVLLSLPPTLLIIHIRSTFGLEFLSAYYP